MSKKLKKKKEKDELTRAAEVMSSRTYQIMVSALEDLVSSKKGLLVAFRVWKENVGMESSTPEVSITEPDDDTKHRVDTNLPVDEADSIYTRYSAPAATIHILVYVNLVWHDAELYNQLRRSIQKLLRKRPKLIFRAQIVPFMRRGITDTHMFAD